MKKEEQEEQVEMRVSRSVPLLILLFGFFYKCIYLKKMLFKASQSRKQAAQATNRQSRKSMHASF